MYVRKKKDRWSFYVVYIDLLRHLKIYFKILKQKGCNMKPYTKDDWISLFALFFLNSRKDF